MRRRALHRNEAARKDRALLIGVSESLLDVLLVEGEPVGIRPPRQRPAKNILSEGTDGWSTCVGSMGPRAPQLELWLDRWTGADSRRLYAGFSAGQSAVDRLVNSSPQRLKPRLKITQKDVQTDGYDRLKEGLPRALFGTPVHERLVGGSFFGFYSRDPPESQTARRRFVDDATRFFVGVCEAMSDVDAEPGFEGVDRRVVRRHLGFDRSAGAAAMCKRRDGYKCRVCGVRFCEVYGDIGRDYAEAHHVTPLHLLNADAVTAAELITVCSNCHRMLHRTVNGKLIDWQELARIVRERQERTENT